MGLQGGVAFNVHVNTQSSHSAMPPTDGSHAGRLLADFLRSVDLNQPPVKMQPPVSDMLRAVAPHAPRALRGLLYHAEIWCEPAAMELRLYGLTRNEFRLCREEQHVSMAVAARTASFSERGQGGSETGRDASRLSLIVTTW